MFRIFYKKDGELLIIAECETPAEANEIIDTLANQSDVAMKDIYIITE